jgi:hypothetical protein
MWLEENEGISTDNKNNFSKKYFFHHFYRPLRQFSAKKWSPGGVSTWH